jgi:ornithine decarboxylase
VQEMKKIASVSKLVNEFPPEEPQHLFREHALKKAANFFLSNFRGRVLYAVKTNPTPFIIKKVFESGITSFDVASIAEVKLVKEVAPEAALFFMHTIKARSAIREAYFTYGVRDFSLDSEEELQKIIEETNSAKDLNLYVRIAIPNTYAELALSDKFGISMKDAPNLIRKAREAASRLGVCFHVGSQCMHQDAYRIAMKMARNCINKSGVNIEMLDVGGGFPSVYPGMIPPDLTSYFGAIHDEFKKFKNYKDIELMCEPGRAIVAESGSVLVRVELRKDSFLYINDGTYGSLFDAGTPHFIFPVKMHRKKVDICSDNIMPFSFFGPTCDTMDFMKGPFYLPEDIKEGDYIEVGQIGAYGKTFNTGFNGFNSAEEIISVDDEPLMTMYDEDPISSYEKKFSVR